MATVNKDFKIKSGLVVEGTTATVNGYDILTKKEADQNYVIGLIGGSSDSANTPNTVVKRDGSGNFAAGEITADLVGNVTGNADTATALETARTIELTGDVTGSVSFDGTANVQISATIDGSFATDAEVATAKQEAIDAAASDATTKANAAQAAAELTASNALSSAVTTLEGQIADAETDANTYTDNAITALNLATTYDAYGAAAQALSDAEDYTDTAVANLVDGAPALLDTLNELAAAIADNPNYATDVANLVAGKQDTLTAGSNIDITGATISVTGLTSAEISDFNSAALSATAAAYDVAGAASSAQEAAEDYADGLAINYDAAGSASAAQTAAETFATNAINDLDTDDIEEGLTNQYFTDARAKSSAADLLTGASLTNITITGTGAGLTITAENGVADSDTDDLVEGSTNLYFTDQRVLDATSNATSVEVQKLDISWVRREEAAYASVATASTSTVHSFGTNEGSVKYLVRVYNNNKSHVTEVLATTDSDHNVAVVEYGTIYTSTNPLATVTVEWNASTSQYDLNVTTANNNSEVLVAATLLAYND
jgi:hypothetical protein